jgi:predicted enzyme related to lactoylglutathione lyase
MAINGTHLLFYTTEADHLRAMLRDVFGFKHVDAGHGWLIFRTPPSEVGVHPAEDGNAGTHAVSFMCDDINATIADLQARGVDVDAPPADRGYGIVTTMHLPGGCDVQLYQPRHPIAAEIPVSRAKAKKKAAKTAAVKKAGKPSTGGRRTVKAPRGRRATTARRRR